ncbi:MAG TPA: FG-GAP-like repeat-containing protein [Anaerolineae bacterium]|nr:FG-GAP-like repeat-containing protein [Anaerolineae bacterium]
MLSFSPLSCQFYTFRIAALEDNSVVGNIITEDTGYGTDSDQDGDPLFMHAHTPPITGTLEIERDGTFTYTPPLNWSGVVEYTYMISDNYLENDGLGDFGPAPFDIFGSGNSWAVTLGDLDGDNDLDAVFAHSNGAQEVWLNSGLGNFGAAPFDIFGGGSSLDMALGDVDGDNDLDVVIPNYNDQPQEVWLNDGSGNFGLTPFDTFGAGDSRAVALGDLDGDNDLDAVIANNDGYQEVWLNDGTGNFGSTRFDIFGTGNNPSRDLALGDFDGDNDLDVVIVAYNGGAHEVWTNDGNGYFGFTPVASFGSSNSSSVTVGDVNGDNDLDIVVANAGSSQQVWLNNGNLTFGIYDIFGNPLPNDTFGGGNSQSIVLGDLDGDNDLDAVVANYNGAQEAWLNNGAGNFGSAAVDIFSAGNSMEIALGDVDGDNDLDVVIANTSDQAQEVWLNQNSASNSLVSNSATITLTITPVSDPPIATDGHYTIVPNSSVTSNIITHDAGYGVDSDGDGDPLTVDTYTSPITGTLDLRPDGTFTYTAPINWLGTVTYTYTINDELLANLNSNNLRKFTSISNLATITITVNVSPTATDGEYMTLEDSSVSGNIITEDTGYGVDNDEDNNPITIYTHTSPITGTLDLRPDGTFTYTPPANWSGITTYTYTISDQNTHFLNSRNFGSTPFTTFGTGYSFDIALGDIDGDNDLDAIIGNDDSQPQEVWLNDGQGNFGQVSDMFNNDGLVIALGDVDNDNDLDIVTAGFFDNNQQVWLNNGDGDFGVNPFATFGAGYSIDIALGDLDGDNDLDVVIANTTGPQEVWLNDGTGNFGSTPLATFGAGNTRSIALGDVDSDNDLDIVIVQSSDQAHEVWLNDGAGNFGASPFVSFGAGDSRSVVLGDVDGDNDLDIVVAQSSNQAEEVWLNDGTGNFGLTPFVTFGTGHSYSVALGDIDGDNDLDAVVANFSGQAQTLWLNDGTGAFGSAPSATFGAHDSLAVALGDIDGDNDLDAVIANYNNQTQEVWLNQKEIVDSVSNVATITITTTPVNDAPIATDGNYVAPEDTLITGNVITENSGYGVDTDVENDPLTVYTYTVPTVGALDVRPDGTFTYTPPINWSGIVTYTYIVTDTAISNINSRRLNSNPNPLIIAPFSRLNSNPSLLSNRGTITITITLVNYLPVATDGNYTIIDTTAPLTGNIITEDSGYGIDSDNDNEPLTVYTYTLPLAGALDLRPDGTFTYTPPTSWPGIVTYTYAIHDGNRISKTFGSPPLDTFGASASYSIALGDVDGDNDLDAVVANIDGEAQEVWLNDGAGNFGTVAFDTFGAGESVDIALGDLDGDNDLDVVVANYYGLAQEVWLNDGSGNFGVVAFDTFGAGDSYAVALGDLDGDGDLDIAIANDANQPQEVWLNDGTGNFGAAPFDTFGGGNSANIALGDVDGDNDLDAVIANFSGQAQEVWLNDGSGNFGAAAFDTFGAGDSYSVALGDLDGDNDLDVVVANDTNQPQEVWLNDGTGNFGAAAFDIFSAGNSHSVALGDVDGDNDLDVVIANLDQAQEVWLNNGSGKFSGSVFDTFGSGRSLSIVLGDVDGDNDLDVVVASIDQAQAVWHNRSDTLFTSISNMATITIATRSPPVATDGAYMTAEDTAVTGNIITENSGYGSDYDINNDPLGIYSYTLPITGTLNLQTNGTFTYTPPLNWSGMVTYTYIISDGITFNIGTGNFGSLPFDTFGNGDSQSIAIGDLNGDNALDVIVANSNGQAQEVWLNDGTGNFGASAFATFGAGDTIDVALGDVDGDNDLDAVIVNNDNDQEVWLNNGLGDFGLTAFGSFGGQNGTAIALGDIDGDDDLDALVSIATKKTQVWRNDGTGNFGPIAADNFGDNNGLAVTLGDVNGDNHLDAIITNGDQGQEVWLNDGFGNFGGAAIDTFGAGTNTALVLGDVDGDNDIDAIVANDSNQAQEVWLNNGSGDFGLTAFDSFGGGNSRALALGDLDGDNDLDVVVANYNGQTQEVWLNDGSGDFGPAVFDTFSGGNSTALALGDVDGDNDLDIIMANDLGEAQEVWLNQDFWTPSLSNRATVTVTVTAVNDPPIALGETYTMTANSTLTVTAPGILANDSDPVEGDSFTLVLQTNVSTGTLDLNSNGAFTYTPPVDYSGPITFTYYVTDGDNSDLVTTTILVEPDGCFPPASVTTVDISMMANDASFTWITNGATNYQLWWSSSDPYFSAGDAGSTVADTVTEPPATHIGGLGDAGTNYYYLVIGQASCGASSLASNRTAEFDFNIVPGTP